MMTAGAVFPLGSRYLFRVEFVRIDLGTPRFFRWAGASKQKLIKAEKSGFERDVALFCYQEERTPEADLVGQKRVGSSRSSGNFTIQTPAPPKHIQEIYTAHSLCQRAFRRGGQQRWRTDEERPTSRWASPTKISLPNAANLFYLKFGLLLNHPALPRLCHVLSHSVRVHFGAFARSGPEQRRGQLSGVVVDPTQAIISGASVTITGPTGGATRTAE